MKLCIDGGLKVKDQNTTFTFNNSVNLISY